MQPLAQVTRRGAVMAAQSRSRARGHVFISYVHDDSAMVDCLERMLLDADIPVWRDTSDLRPGEDWRARIRDAITVHALVFIACFSENSLFRAKSYQNEELTLAVEQLRMRQPEQPWLIPVRLDDCQIPDWEIGASRTLNSIQRVDLFGDRLDVGFARLLAAIRRILRHPDADEAGTQSGQPGPAMRYQESESHVAGSQAASPGRGDIRSASPAGPSGLVRPHRTRLAHQVARLVRHRRALVVAGSAVMAVSSIISAVLAAMAVTTSPSHPIATICHGHPEELVHNGNYWNAPSSGPNANLITDSPNQMKSFCKIAGVNSSWFALRQKGTSNCATWDPSIGKVKMEGCNPSSNLSQDWQFSGPNLVTMLVAKGQVLTGDGASKPVYFAPAVGGDSQQGWSFSCHANC